MIDVTTITSGMEDIISDWRVSKLESHSDHRIIEFKLSAPKVERKYKTVMTDQCKRLFTEQIKEEARTMLESIDKESKSVQGLEELMNGFITMINKLSKANSRTYEVKIESRSIIWRDARVKKQIKIRDRAQREQRRKRDPRTARALDKENKAIKRLNKTVRDEIFKGKLDRIITTDDMSRLAKYAKNGKAREIAFIKDGEGTLANSPEDAIQNLSQAHFPSSIPLSEDTIMDRMLVAGSERGIKFLRI